MKNRLQFYTFPDSLGVKARSNAKYIYELNFYLIKRNINFKIGTYLKYFLKIYKFEETFKKIEIKIKYFI